MVKNKIADNQELLVYWTKTVRDESADEKIRIKTSELLAKALGMFDERAQSSREEFTLALEEKIKLAEILRENGFDPQTQDSRLMA